MFLPSDHPYYRYPPNELIRKFRAFRPTDFPNCQAWYDPSDPTSVTIGTGVSQLNDKSGNSRHAVQATGANQPAYLPSGMNGRNCLSFGGGNTFLTTPTWPYGAASLNIDASDRFTIFAVFLPITLSSGAGRVFARQTPFSAPNRTLEIEIDILSGRIRTNIRNNIGIYAGGSLVNPTVFMFRWNGAALNTGEQAIIGSRTVGDATPVGNNGIIGAFFNGNIGEIILYDTDVNPYRRQFIEGYMMWKWGAQSVIPVDHPYVTKTSTVVEY